MAQGAQTVIKGMRCNSSMTWDTEGTEGTEGWIRHGPWARAWA